MNINRVLLCLCLWSGLTAWSGHCLGSPSLVPTAELRISRAEASEPPLTVFAVPSFASVEDSLVLPTSGAASGPMLTLFAPTDQSADGCSLFPPSKTPAPGTFVALVRRGVCTFATKMANVAQSGAVAVVVADTVTSAYEDLPAGGAAGDLPQLKDVEGGPCLVNCELGDSLVSHQVANQDFSRGFPDTNCAKNRRCASRLCALTGQNSSAGWASTSPPDRSGSVDTQYRICCLPDRYVEMMVVVPPPNTTAHSSHSSPAKTVPALFIAASDALRIADLQHSADGNSVLRVQAGLRAVSTWQSYGSPLLIWMLGCTVLVMGTYYSAKNERKGRQTPMAMLSSSMEEPTIHLTTQTAQGYILMAIVGLIVIYFLVKAFPHVVVVSIIGIFCVAGFSSLRMVVFLPLLTQWFPRLEQRRCAAPGCLASWGVVISAADLISSCLAFVLVWFYFVTRHEAGSWVLQDLISIVVCCQFLAVLRLNKLKTSAILLLGFMAYDIFMVFISPVIFKESVMVEVATAGRGSAQPSASRPHECVRIPDERMPMLFMIPNWSFYGGFSMLGLGDVLLPGLLISFALRFDTLITATTSASSPLSSLNTGKASATHRSSVSRWLPSLFCGCCQRTMHCYPHYVVCCIGYAVGLLMAYAANTLGLTINGVRGQPALLYLVPCTLIPFSVMARCRGTWTSLWDGPECLVGAEGGDGGGSTAAAAAAAAPEGPEGGGAVIHNNKVTSSNRPSPITSPCPHKDHTPTNSEADTDPLLATTEGSTNSSSSRGGGGGGGANWNSGGIPTNRSPSGPANNGGTGSGGNNRNNKRVISV